MSGASCIFMAEDIIVGTLHGITDHSYRYLTFKEAKNET